MSDNVKSDAVARESMRFAQLVTAAASKGIIKKCGFSVPRDEAVKNARARAVSIGGRRMLQLETFRKDGKALQRNIPEDDSAALGEFTAGFMRADLTLEGGAACEYRANANGNATVIGAGAAMSAIEKARAAPLRAAATTAARSAFSKGTSRFCALSASAMRTGAFTTKNSRSSARYAAFSSIYARSKDTCLPTACCAYAISAAEKAISRLRSTIILP